MRTLCDLYWERLKKRRVYDSIPHVDHLNKYTELTFKSKHACIAAFNEILCTILQRGHSCIVLDFCHLPCSFDEKLCIFISPSCLNSELLLERFRSCFNSSVEFVILLGLDNLFLAPVGFKASITNGTFITLNLSWTRQR